MNLIAPAQTSGRKFLNRTRTLVSAPGTTLRILVRAFRERRLGQPPVALGPFHTDLHRYAQPPADGLRVTWMGHASLLIELDGARILTDPVWSRRVSPVPFAGPKRFYPPPASIGDLPPIDLVLLSHDHYDHLDRATIRRLNRLPAPPRFVCPLGVGALLVRWGVPRARITELNWGEGVQHSDIAITATPARHFSGRGLWNRNRTLWASFVLRGPRHNVFYSGDSGPTPAFAQIGSSYGPFYLTLMAIGAYDPAWPAVHLTPEEAIDAHRALGGRLLLPIHWGLFNLAFHPWQEPVERLLACAERFNVPLVLPTPGAPTDITGEALNSGWWESRAGFLPTQTHSPVPATPAPLSSSH